MVKKPHPSDRLQRRLMRLAKKKVNGTEKKKETERPGRVWKKLNKEFLEEQETYNELRTIL